MASWISVNSTIKATDKAFGDPAGNWLLKTGHSEYTKRKKIYVLAGNLWGYTSEMSPYYRVSRGGYYASFDNGGLHFDIFLT